jgi:hypothetical protein
MKKETENLLIKSDGEAQSMENSILNFNRPKFFENLPEIIRPQVAAAALGISIKTIYDWRYRQKVKGIPPTVFLKINRLLYIRRDELRKWIASYNTSSA